MKTVVVFQGGGALAAFGAGVWQALARSTALGEGELIAVAGASLGVVNAATAAYRHASEDGGAGHIGALWRERIATPSFPFFGTAPFVLPPSSARVQDWNGYATGTLLGTRGLFSALWNRWQPLEGLWRRARPLHDRSAMWRLFESEFPSYASAPGGGPMLAVASVDVMAGELHLFDSDSAPLTARHLAASSALPLLFEPVEIDGRMHWDGEVTRDSLLPLLLQRLRDGGRLARGEPLRLVTIDQFPRAFAAAPASGAEMAYRALNLMQAGKLEPPAIEGVRIERLHAIVREPLPEDGVSGQFDYSPQRIERLMAQGRDAARAVLVASAAPPRPAPALAAG